MSKSIIPRFIQESSVTAIARAMTRARADVAESEAELRRRLCEMCHVGEAILFPSARAGLYWILKAIKPPRIYLPAYLCSSVYECCLRAGVPITYVDLYEGTFEQRCDEVEYEQGSVLLLVHQYGIPSNPEKAMAIAERHKLVLVEDNAAALGAEWKGVPTGSFGDAAIVSFEYSKTVSACRGGGVVFRNEELARSVKGVVEEEAQKDVSLRRTRWLRDAIEGVVNDIALRPSVYGLLTLPLFRVKNGAFVDRSMTIREGGHYGVGFGKRRAFLALNIIKDFDQLAQRRRDIARIYGDVLRSCDEIVLPRDEHASKPLHTHYPVLVPSEMRQQIVQKLWRLGVDPGFNFSYLCGGQQVAAAAPTSLDYTSRILTLPVSSRLSIHQARYIAETFVAAVNAVRDECEVCP